MSAIVCKNGNEEIMDFCKTLDGALLFEFFETPENETWQGRFLLFTSLRTAIYETNSSECLKKFVGLTNGEETSKRTHQG